MAKDESNEVERIRTMADSLDCLLEDDFRLLAGATQSTVEAWRPRWGRKPSRGSAFLGGVRSPLRPTAAPDATSQSCATPALEWNERGVLKPIHFSARAASDELAVLAALRSALGAGVTVNTTTASAFSAAKCLEPYLPAEFANAKGARRVHRALASLQSSGDIHREAYRSDNRKSRERWVLAHGAGDASV